MALHDTSYRAGSIAFILTGAGHLLSQLVTPQSRELSDVFDVMRHFAIKMPGGGANLYQFYTGFSLMMGIMLIGYGALALLAMANGAGGKDTRLLALHVVVSGIAVAMSVKFFFVVPIVLMAIAFGAFAMALLLGGRRT